MCRKLKPTCGASNNLESFKITVVPYPNPEVGVPWSGVSGAWEESFPQWLSGSRPQAPSFEAPQRAPAGSRAKPPGANLCLPIRARWGILGGSSAASGSVAWNAPQWHARRATDVQRRESQFQALFECLSSGPNQNLRFNRLDTRPPRHLDNAPSTHPTAQHRHERGACIGRSHSPCIFSSPRGSAIAVRFDASTRLRADLASWLPPLRAHRHHRAPPLTPARRRRAKGLRGLQLPHLARWVAAGHGRRRWPRPRLVDRGHLQLRGPRLGQAAPALPHEPPPRHHPLGPLLPQRPLPRLGRRRPRNLHLPARQQPAIARGHLWYVGQQEGGCYLGFLC